MGAVFSSRGAFESFLLHSAINLTKLITAVLLWLTALTLLFLGLLTAWLLGVTGTEAAAALRAAWQTSTVQVLSAVGFSLLTLIGVGWWLAKRIHGWLGREVVLKYVQGPLRD